MLYGMSLRESYEFLRFTEKTIKENGFGNNEATKNLLIRIKKDIRKVVNKKEGGMFEELEENFVSGWGNGDYEFHLKYFFPDEHWTEEEKAEFKDAFWIECPYSAYDCTGAIFTSFINVFDVPKGTIVHMWMSVDV